MIEIKRRATQPPAGAYTVAASKESLPIAQSAAQRQIKPFTAIDARRDYRKMYRAVWDFHERHSPPPAGVDSLPYWEEAAADMGRTAATFGNDPFIMGLLCAVYEEMEREYLQQGQGAGESLP